ncbi:helix-turn-helix domain-containing protein [Amycolatopsis magusensis]|uniref:Transcriptional regulator with XRE-family HTH domain n=1 Tax=Amycolatopsis magusensis TaxID=882444 RepID=A0ABS4PNX4_9PSEU|nr:helix-turn-helix transcriptional regulator [Amycolatopsis magusensis]MBP2181097.1 transcriptional regulator with XRE-family HTH domain [Amycolatopsis magusensis]MDI5981821.1 helix-turn-helix transcriptional regulator [Amycolatopsis magusensis]
MWIVTRQLTFQVELGRNLRLARALANLRREEVAERMLSQPSTGALGAWETGVRQIPLDRLVDYCRVVGQPVASVWPTEGHRIQVIHAPRLRKVEDPQLKPLAAWAEAYGDELIRLTPGAIEAAAMLCGVAPDWLRRRLLKLQRF